MSLKRVNYMDEIGRNKVVLLPEHVSEEDAKDGVPVGPPPLETLNLPPEVEVRLHNELFIRGIIEPKDALRNRPAIMQAIMSAFKVDVDRIVTIYLGEDYRNARSEPAEDITNKTVPTRRPRQPRKQT